MFFDHYLTKNFAVCPVACHGDECMPYAEGYKGDGKSPLSSEAIARICYNMKHGIEEGESCGI